ncbi:MAG TPA: DUF3105 domain-containing protein [Gaiellaceae bacterium]|nr:DUF3105 domain-containing protein [Gaiellaceae bacterium]
MPKKAKTPPPPRRPVQAPKQRSAERTPAERRTLLYLVIFSASGIVILGAVLALLAFGGGGGDGGSGSKDIGSAMRKAGCTYRQYTMPAPKGDMHVNSLTAKIDWVTHPPSGGQHYPTPAPFNFYDETVNPRVVVHNLEHGAVVIWYGPKISPQTKEKLRSFYQSSPVGLVATQYAGYGTKIALAAWTGNSKKYQKNGYYGEGHLSVCQDFNEKAFKTFRDAYRGHGPEGFPLSQLQPGQ